MPLDYLVSALVTLLVWCRSGRPDADVHRHHRGSFRIASAQVAAPGADRGRGPDRNGADRQLAARQPLGISLSAFRIAGGLLLFRSASECLRRAHAPRRSNREKAIEEQCAQHRGLPLGDPAAGRPVQSQRRCAGGRARRQPSAARPVMAVVVIVAPHVSRLIFAQRNRTAARR